MRIIDIVSRINRKMNNYNLNYDELMPVLDEAVDKLNALWYLELPMISDLPETDGNGVPTEYNNIPDEIIRRFIVPYAAGRQFSIYELDGSSELNEAAVNLGELSHRWGQVAHREGLTPFAGVKKYLGLIQESYEDTVFEVPGTELSSVSNDDYNNPF